MLCSPPEALLPTGVMQPAGSTRRSARSLSPLSRLSAAILGMHNLSPATRTILLQLSPASLSRLETELERHDPRRTGIVELERFHRAMTLARIPSTEAATGIERAGSHAMLHVPRHACVSLSS
jgi:hypothetical protein